MSNDALCFFRKQDIRPCGRKFILMALADYADEADRCFPSVEHLAGYTSQGESTVREHLRALEQEGWITRERCRNQDGTLGGYRYKLHRRNPSLVKSTTGEKPKKPALKSGGQYTSNPPTEGDTPRAREDFDQRACDRFWEAYPEAGRVNFARSSLPIALGRHVARLRSVERLIGAARNYAAAIRKQDTKPKALGNWLADPALVDQYAPPEAPYVDSPADPAALSHAQWRSYVGYFHRKGDWAGPGPRPDRDGCLAPQSVLDEFGFAKREGDAA